MKKKMIIISSILVIIVLLSNYTILKSYIGGLPVYNYETKNKEFQNIEVPWKGLKFNQIKSNFEVFKKNNPDTKDTVLYRNFKINPLKFWNWHDYLVHERYKLAYKKE